MNDGNRPGQVPMRAVDAHPGGAGSSKRVVERLGHEAALELLAAAPYGRIVFVWNGEPQIRPLSHLVDDGAVIVRTGWAAALSDALAGNGGLRITYEADDLDVERREGWSVIVSGSATPVAEPTRQSHYKQLLRTMLAGSDDAIIAIRPKSVSGIRIVPAPAGVPEQR